MSNYDVVFKNVAKSYGKNTVIKDLSFQVYSGERLILLGPSGCGKSTSLRMIAGLEDVSGGEILMNNQVVNDVISGDRNVSMVFQNYALYPHMTVEQNITYALRVHKTEQSIIKERLETVLDVLGLTEYAKRKPRELSGGQRQRVALARALVKQSKYLLLDEPLSNLDAQLRVHARKELVKIHEMFGQTFIYVTHDQVEAMTVGTRIALLNKGELMMIDTPQNVYNRPANVFTAKFIGSPATNIAKCIFCEGALKIEGQTLAIPDMWRAKISAHGNNDLFFGIRPEHVHLSTKPIDGALMGTVKYVEDYGNKCGIYFSLGSLEFISISETMVAAPGESVYFLPKYEKIHIFDGETENSIGYPVQLENPKKVGLMA